MSEINYEIIQQYINGELSGEALLAFEKEMQVNPELVKEVALYKMIEGEMTLHLQQQVDQQNLSTTLKDLSHQYFKKKEAKVKSINHWWYAAASVAAAAAILFFIFRPFSSGAFNSEKLFAYYVKEVEPLSSAERGNKADTLVTRAVSLYNKKDYQHAMPLLQSISVKQPGDVQLLMATGICYLQTGQYDSSINLFDKISTGTTVFKNDAVWYKALVFLKQNKPEDCYTVLLTLSNDADKYKEAQELMKKIASRKK